jgi:hypothetical protein
MLEEDRRRLDEFILENHARILASKSYSVGNTFFALRRRGERISASRRRPGFDRQDPAGKQRGADG